MATSSLPSFDLDFVGLDVSSVRSTVRRRRLGSTTPELVVTPAVAVRQGAAFTTVVRYGGQPRGYPYSTIGGIFPTADGVIVAGEPEAAATWFPVNDHPRDKATYTIKITAPTGLAALSNGVLQSKVDSAKAGFTTWTWRESSPMASYLATMVIGNYRVHESTHDGLPVVTAVDSDLPTSVDNQLAGTPQIVDFLETFGPYPFDALGGIVVDDPRVAFALENQTRPIYGPVLRRRRPKATSWSPTSWHTSGSATASRCTLERHLAQRGLRHLRRVAVGRATRRTVGAADLRQPLQPMTPAFWQVPPGDPGKGQAVRLGGLLPRRADPAGAAGHGGRRHVPPDPAQVGIVQEGR